MRANKRTVISGGKLHDRNDEESWAILKDLALYDNESWNDPRDFAKPVKAIFFPQDVPSTSDCRLIELENQVQRLMEAHLAPTQNVQVNKISSSCEICSGPHDTQYCMENPEQAFVDYTSSRTDEAGEGLVSNFMASQDARLSKFEADFKQQQSEMTNKINSVLKAITDRIAGALPSDTVKNLKLSTSPVLSARSYLTMDPQCSAQIHNSINAITIHLEQQRNSRDDKTEKNEEEEKDSPENTYFDSSTPPDPSISFITKKVLKFNSLFESLGLVLPSSNTELVCTKEDDGEVMFLEIVSKDDNSHKEEPEAGEQEVEYFDIFQTRSELTYHKYLMCGPIPSMFLRNPIITEGCSSNLKIPCNIGHVHVEKAYIDLNSPLNIMTRMMYNWIMRRKLDPRENSNRVIEQYDSPSELEKEHTKSVYLRNEEDKRRGVEYVMSKILGFYKECLELGPEYLIGMDDEGEVIFDKKKHGSSYEVSLRILGGRFNQLSHVSSLLPSKPGEY
ncbi:hypothetical protein Tco_0751629 [Tanacetum coccineum]|uniref:MAK10-like protein n=1 Tax=Tanacetum coccineum TaxID=301880 RepID=A0ABQ4Z875_9ASTR